MNASRSRRFRSRRCAVSAFDSVCRSAIAGILGCCHSPILPATAQPAEADGDAPAIDRDHGPAWSVLESTAQVGEVVAQDVQVSGPVWSDIRRVELPGDDRGKGGDVTERSADGLVSRVSRRCVLDRTDVLIVHNTRRAFPA